MVSAHRYVRIFFHGRIKQVTQSTLTPEERDRKLRNIFGC